MQLTYVVIIIYHTEQESSLTAKVRFRIHKTAPLKINVGSRWWWI